MTVSVLAALSVGSSAWAGEALDVEPRGPSRALGWTAGVGLTVGALGAVGVGLAVENLFNSPEPLGAFIIGPPSAVLFGVGTVTAGIATWAQAKRLKAPAVLAPVGLGLLASGIALGVGGAVAGGDVGTLAGAIGGPIVASVGWLLIAGQGVRNRSEVRRRSLVMAPRLGDTWGLTLGARF